MELDQLLPSFDTLLQAVNLAITSLGESQLDSLEGDLSVDADDALFHLSQANLEVQSQGWHWNRAYGVVLPLATNGTVPLPEGTLRVTPAYAPGVASPVSAINITQRGDQLYNLDTNSFQFTCAPVVDMVQSLLWGQMPRVARNYIATLAARRFQATKQQSQIVLQIQNDDVQRALTLLQQHEDEVAGTNSVDGNVNTLTALYGIGGMRRNRGGY